MSAARSLRGNHDAFDVSFTNEQLRCSNLREIKVMAWISGASTNALALFESRFQASSFSWICGLPQKSRRIAGHDIVCWYVPGHHGTCADDRAFADGQAA